MLTGGVGGAKLVDGLARVLPAGQLTAIVNTADDFTHLGLRICPDLDSVLYMLSGKSDPVRGWGVRDESWNFMAELGEWGGPDWFNLGDRDLAMHVLRTQALDEGCSLTDFTDRMVQSAGVRARLLPLSEDPVMTMVETDIGTLPFQEYFVRHQCAPQVRAVRFQGATDAVPTPQVLDALADPQLKCVLVAPSNPYLSVDPILSVPGLGEAIRASDAPVVAVSPIIGGKAVKGPTAKMMQEMGLEVTNATIAAHYGDLLDGLLIDRSDAADDLSLACRAEDTMMRNAEDRERVATAALDLARSLA